MSEHRIQPWESAICCSISAFYAVSNAKMYCEPEKQWCKLIFSSSIFNGLRS